MILLYKKDILLYHTKENLSIILRFGKIFKQRKKNLTIIP